MIEKIIQRLDTVNASSTVLSFGKAVKEHSTNKIQCHCMLQYA